MRTARRDTDLAGLLDLAARGDRAAYGVFIDRTAPIAFRLALALTGGARAAEELAQSCYRDAWTQLHEYPTSGRSPLAWLLVGLQHTTSGRDPAGRDDLGDLAAVVDDDVGRSE